MDDEKNNRTEEIEEAVNSDQQAEYKYDYRDRQASMQYFPVAAYVGIIVAILVGALIIGFSIILSSGKYSDLRGSNSNIIAAANNSDSQIQNAPAYADIKLLDEYPFMGSKDAPITLVEFADFQCPFCKKFHDEALSKIKSEYIDKGIVKFYFLHFPFLGPESDAAAIAAECARQQNKFWEYHDLLYKTQGLENSGAFSDESLLELAKQAGLDIEKFNSCKADPKVAEAVKQQMEIGQQNGVEATPTVFINGAKYEGSNPFSSYQALIEKLKK